jgi:hypothetical protein
MKAERDASKAENTKEVMQCSGGSTDAAQLLCACFLISKVGMKMTIAGT